MSAQVQPNIAARLVSHNLRTTARTRCRSNWPVASCSRPKYLVERHLCVLCRQSRVDVSLPSIFESTTKRKVRTLIRALLQAVHHDWVRALYIPIWLFLVCTLDCFFDQVWLHLKSATPVLVHVTSPVPPYM